MKKILAVILALAMLLSLSACSLSDVVTTATSVISGGGSADSITVNNLEDVSGNKNIFQGAVIISTDAIITVTISYECSYTSSWAVASNSRTIDSGMVSGSGSITILVTDPDDIYTIQQNGLLIGIGSFSGTIPASKF